MKVKVKLTFRSNDKTINTIATNSKEMGQLITESLRKEKQALSDNKKIQKSEKKNLTLKHSGETLSIQEGKCHGNTTKLKEEHVFQLVANGSSTNAQKLSTKFCQE